MLRNRSILAAGILVTVTACASTDRPQDQMASVRQVAVEADAAVKAGKAELIAVNGAIQDNASRVLGRVAVVSDPNGAGLIVRVALRDFRPGAYGVHLHSVGRCDGPDFQTAGAHWNPTGAAHGRDNPAGAHMGDLPNVTVGSDGAGSLEFTVKGATLTTGANPLLDADGAALVIHAKADDYRTDPSGNSGARVACAVLSK